MHKVKCFQVLRCITNNSIKQYFSYPQLNDQTVLFLTIHFKMSTKIISSKYTTNLIPHQSFVHTHLPDQAVLFLAIQFCICHWFALFLKINVPSLNVKELYLPH